MYFTQNPTLKDFMCFKFIKSFGYEQYSTHNPTLKDFKII